MKLREITLENFRLFEHLHIPFEDCQRIIFIGDNGAGKTSALAAIAKGLSWLVARIKTERGNGSPIADSEIFNGKPAAVLTLKVDHLAATYQWTLVKTRTGRKKTRESQLTHLTDLANHFRLALTDHAEETSLPLVVYYPVERVVLDIPLKIKEKHNFEQLDGYDNALQQGVDFRRFFEWFRNREDSENEAKTYLPMEVHEILLRLKDTDHSQIWAELDQLHLSKKDRQLTAVRSAILSFMPGFSNLRIQRRPRLRMLIDKEGQPLEVGQLSQGEKSLMALVGDIARRLAMMNPGLTNPLEGEGVVLIDEVDMHLHPRWQRTIVGGLAKTFPRCQFILTTHSPIVLSQEREICGFVLSDGKMEPIGHTFGLDVNQVLLQEMNADIRNPEVQDTLDGLLNAIQDGDVDQAQNRIAELGRVLPADNLELAKARLLLRRLLLRQQ